jgi:hypothetical protein
LLHTANVNVAMSAQKKLLHMVRMLKTWLISCKLIRRSLIATQTYFYGE